MTMNNRYPAIAGQEKEILEGGKPIPNAHREYSNIQFDKTQAAFGIVLHMHQPTIPAGSDDLPNAPLVSNLQNMLEHPNEGDNHNAPVFLQCYSRMSTVVRDMVDNGKNPRVMLDYSGNLLWGLQQINNGEVLANLKRVTTDKKYFRNVEWVGTMWSHAVATSTPIPDLFLHLKAWRHHFGSIFGKEALSRVKGFSPPEMHLPIHPDVCFEYIKALKDAGYEWLMVQEHTIEYMDGASINRPHFPHRLVAKNSLGDIIEMPVLIKTQGSDTKLVAQMQPFYEAKSNQRQDYAGQILPPFVLQVSDGENGGVMMNEFPPAYNIAFDQIGTDGVVAMNGSEYLEFLEEKGVKTSDFLPVQPISQNRIWKHLSQAKPGAVDEAIKDVQKEDAGFNLDKGSWTSDISWVKGYEDVLDPINKLSVEFHKKYPNGHSSDDPRYQEALLHLLLSQTSCFRYWGEGIWTEYAKEICRRGMKALQ